MFVFCNILSAQHTMPALESHFALNIFNHLSFNLKTKPAEINPLNWTENLQPNFLPQRHGRALTTLVQLVLLHSDNIHHNHQSSQPASQGACEDMYNTIYMPHIVQKNRNINITASFKSIKSSNISSLMLQFVMINSFVMINHAPCHIWLFLQIYYIRHMLNT